MLALAARSKLLLLKLAFFDGLTSLTNGQPILVVFKKGLAKWAPRNVKQQQRSRVFAVHNLPRFHFPGQSSPSTHFMAFSAEANKQVRRHEKQTTSSQRHSVHAIPFGSPKAPPWENCVVHTHHSDRKGGDSFSFSTVYVHYHSIHGFFIHSKA